MDQNEKWIKVADDISDISFNDKNIATIQIAEKSICIVKTEKGLKACSSRCPHAGGDLSEGFLDKRENIICPVHNYRFSLKNGRDTNDEGYFLKIFGIKENEEGVFIEMI